MRLNLRGFLLSLVAVLTVCSPCFANVDIPVYPGAFYMLRQDYRKPNMPDKMPQNAQSARVLIYRLPKTVTPDQVKSFYSDAMLKQHWSQGPETVITGDRYLRFGRGRDEQLIIRIREQADYLLVDGLGLVIPTEIPLGRNYAESTLDKHYNALPAGGSVHVVCPAGTVVVSAAPKGTPGVDVHLVARALVGYPRTADEILKDVTIIAQMAPSGLTIEAVPDGAPGDPTAATAFEYTVTVPEGTNVAIEVGHEVEGPLVQYLKRPDATVDAMGSLGSVTIVTTGPVKVSGALGSVDVKTANNPVVLRHLGGDVSAHTSGMWIKADDLTIHGNVDLETTDARIEARISTVQDGALRCVTEGAPVRLRFPADASIDLTVLGARHCATPFAMQSTLQAGACRYHGVWNGGRAPVDVETSGGADVDIESTLDDAAQTPRDSRLQNIRPAHHP